MRMTDGAQEGVMVNDMLEQIEISLIQFLNLNGHLKVRKKHLQEQVKLALGRPVKNFSTQYKTLPHHQSVLG